MMRQPVRRRIVFTLFATLLGVATSFAALPASADLSDDTGSWGVQGVDTEFGVRPLSSVAAMESMGNLIFVGGKFTNVSKNGVPAVDQSYLAAFDATTGDYEPGFDVELDGPVNAMTAYDGKLLIGGQFETVNGVRRTGIALLDPETGDLDTSFNLVVNGGSPANVRGFDLVGDYLYVTGSFDRIVANGASIEVGNVGRFDVASDQVDASWRPDVDAANWAIAADVSNDRVYVASFAAGGLVTLDLKTGATVQTGFDGGTIRQPYDVKVYRGKVWVAGAEHALFVLDAASLSVERYHYSGRAGQADPWNGGEYQALEIIGDRVYASCHCNYESYLVGENTRKPISFLVAFDADSGLHIPSFDPHLTGNSGPWAITEGPDGCIWTGGDLRKSASQKIENIARICEVVDIDGAPLVDLARTATVTVGDGWTEFDLGVVRPVAYVQARADLGDNFIVLAETSFRDDKTPAELTGMEGYTGSRFFSNYAVNDRWFSITARYVRIYTTAPVDVGTISVFGHDTAIDIERPSLPAGFAASPDDTNVDLSWSAASDNVAVTGYQLFRTDDLAADFELVATVPTTAYLDTGLADGDYWYYLKAFDAAGNTSWRTGYRAVTVLAGAPAPDTERPTTPRGLSARLTGNELTLSWTGSTDNVGVVGYVVADADGRVFATPATTTARITTLTPGTSYSLSVKAIDEAGNTSWRSNTVIVTP